MRKSNVALRLQTSLLEEAKRVAESEGVALNQLINVAVAERRATFVNDPAAQCPAKQLANARGSVSISRATTFSPRPRRSWRSHPALRGSFWALRRRTAA